MAGHPTPGSGLNRRPGQNCIGDNRPNAGRRSRCSTCPPYSPELNPDEGLNADLKQAATRKPPARSKDELKRNLVSHLRSLSKRPSRIRSYFDHQTFRYAA